MLSLTRAKSEQLLQTNKHLPAFQISRAENSIMNWWRMAQGNVSIIKKSIPLLQSKHKEILFRRNEKGKGKRRKKENGNHFPSIVFEEKPIHLNAAHSAKAATAEGKSLMWESEIPIRIFHLPLPGKLSSHVSNLGWLRNPCCYFWELPIVVVAAAAAAVVAAEMLSPQAVEDDDELEVPWPWMKATSFWGESKNRNKFDFINSSFRSRAFVKKCCVLLASSGYHCAIIIIMLQEEFAARKTINKD